MTARQLAFYLYEDKVLGRGLFTYLLLCSYFGYNLL